MSVVYLSSTFKDLQAERDAAYRAMRRLGHDVIAMEDYVAADVRPLDKCLADVRRSDIYVGLLGWRYGYVPPGHTRSVTELEFREAVKQRNKCKCLVFLQEESTKRAPVDRGDRRRIETFRREIERRYLASYFASPDDLAAKVTAAVANVFGELRDAIGKLDLPLARVIDAVKRLGDAPKLSPNDLREEIDHLQRDAMNWVSDGRSLRSAELRLVEARRLIAEAVRRERASAPLLALRGYVEKTAGQICDGRRDGRGAKAAYGAAARYFRAALKLDPSDVSALNGQANILGIQGQHQKAVTLGRVVTSYCPDYTAAFWDLSIELEQLVDPKKPAPNLVRELADVYETLVELIPNEPSGFTPAELATAQRQAHHYRELATQLGGAHAHPHRGRRTS